jgi:NitT/TauT family transport system substrate-binding protein
MRRDTLRSGSIAAVALLVVLACAALVGSASTTAAASTRAPAAKTSTKLTSINFGLASVNMLYAPYVVGQAAGIFKRNGIQLNVVLTKDAATAEAAVASSQTPIGAITTDAIAISHDANPQVAIMLPVVMTTPYSLVVNPSIKKIGDLRGKALGASGLATADGGIIRAILDFYGMKVGNDYTIAVTGDPAARTSALLNGQTAGIAAPEPQLTILKNQGFKELVSATTIPGLSARPFNMIAVNRGWAAKHPATVVAFEKAWLNSVKYMYANPKASIAALAAGLNTPADVMADAYGDWLVSKKVFPQSCALPLYLLKNVISAQIGLENMKAPGPKPASLLLGGKYCQQAMATVTKKKK